MKTINEGNKGQSVTKNIFFMSSLFFVCSLFFFFFFFFNFKIKGRGEGEQVNQHGLEENGEHAGEGGKNLSDVS